MLDNLVRITGDNVDATLEVRRQQIERSNIYNAKLDNTELGNR